jgi:hypothetical protein
MDAHRAAESPSYFQGVCKELTLRQIQSVLSKGNGIDGVGELSHKKACDLLWQLARQSPERLRLQWDQVAGKLTKQQLVDFCSRRQMQPPAPATKMALMGYLRDLDVFDLRAQPVKARFVPSGLTQSLKRAAWKRLQRKRKAPSSTATSSSSRAAEVKPGSGKLKKDDRRLLKCSVKLVLRSSGLQQNLKDVRAASFAACASARQSAVFDVNCPAAVAVVDKAVFKFLRSRFKAAEEEAAKPVVAFGPSAQSSAEEENGFDDLMPVRNRSFFARVCALSI